MTDNNILIVEDNGTHRLLAKEILLDLGYMVTTADNGYAALAKIAADPMQYQLVLMDWEMPDMNGLEAVRAIRARQMEEGWPHIPVMAFTSNKNDGDMEKCLAAGMDDYVIKEIFMPKWRALLNEKLLKWLKPQSHKISAKGGA